jgi:hypothetical protein
MRENPLFLSVGLGHSSLKTLAQYEHEVRVQICPVSQPHVIPDIEYLQSITTPRLNTTHPAPNSAAPMMEDRRGPTLSNIAPRGRADTYITISSESSPGLKRKSNIGNTARYSEQEVESRVLCFTCLLSLSA